MRSGGRNRVTAVSLARLCYRSLQRWQFRLRQRVGCGLKKERMRRRQSRRRGSQVEYRRGSNQTQEKKNEKKAQPEKPQNVPNREQKQIGGRTLKRKLVPEIPRARPGKKKSKSEMKATRKKVVWKLHPPGSHVACDCQQQLTHLGPVISVHRCRCRVAEGRALRQRERLVEPPRKKNRNNH